jgi:CheY-like chemotaxis protein
MSSPPRVLLVDDEPALLELYTTWLADLDVTLVRADCGVEALEYCDEGDVDVAILDRHMPRVSGDEVLDTIRTDPDAPRVAFVSAATPDVRILDLDIDAYLTKPVSREEFVDLVQSLLRRRGLPDSVDRYVEMLSKRFALLQSTSRSVLRSEPTYVTLESELSTLADRVDPTGVDDPFLRRALPDGGSVEPAPDSPA